MKNNYLKYWLRQEVLWLIAGAVFSLISISLAHLCQIIKDNNETCKNFAFPFHLIADLTKISSEKIAFAAAVIIILIIFLIVGAVSGIKKQKD